MSMSRSAIPEIIYEPDRKCFLIRFFSFIRLLFKKVLFLMIIFIIFTTHNLNLTNNVKIT